MKNPVALRRRCAACGGLRGELIFEQRFAQIESISILSGYDVVACSHCGFCFADGLPDQETFDHYYRIASKYEAPNEGAHLADHLRQRFLAEIDELKPHLPRRESRILEIGCATGALLAMLRDDGYPNVMGFDPSPQCARIAREVHGLDVQAGSLFSLGKAYSNLDALLVIGVLEHLRDLERALEGMHRALAPGGILYIEVPDASRFVDHPDAAFQEFSVEHINYFSPASLAALGGAHGFETVAVIQNTRPHHNGQADPALVGIFRSIATATAPAQADRSTADALRAYVELSEKREQPIRALIDELVASQKPLVVWGCGTLTLRELAAGNLGKARITAFADSNDRYWGQSLSGRPIFSPDRLRLGDEAVLASSVGHRQGIVSAIRARLGPSVEILVYPD